VAVTAGAMVFVSGCAAVEKGSDRASEVANGVGQKVEYHAQKVKRKTVSVWHWLFGGGDDSTPKQKAKTTKPQPAGPAAPLPNYQQQYVGKET